MQEEMAAKINAGGVWITTSNGEFGEEYNDFIGITLFAEDATEENIEKIRQIIIDKLIELEVLS